MRATTRISRLEAAATTSQAGTLTFDEHWRLLDAVDDWLESHGFEDELAAVESSVSIPAEMHDDVRAYAVHCKRRRVFAKFEAGESLTAADMEALALS